MKKKILAKLLPNITINILKQIIAGKTKQQIRKERIYRELIKAILNNPSK